MFLFEKRKLIRSGLRGRTNDRTTHLETTPIIAIQQQGPMLFTNQLHKIIYQIIVQPPIMFILRSYLHFNLIITIVIYDYGMLRWVIPH